jgi:hypothetical protein
MVVKFFIAFAPGVNVINFYSSLTESKSAIVFVPDKRSQLGLTFAGKARRATTLSITKLSIIKLSHNGLM